MRIFAVGFGSNLGDRFAHIESALRLIEHPDRFLPPSQQQRMHVCVVNTSFLYETSPMYVVDQPEFVNGACLVETNLEPMQLLALFKAVESAVGRVPSIRYGPRAVDLDVLLCGSEVIDTRTSTDDLEGQLVVPHPKLAEREFVLRPLNDMIPDVVHPLLKKTVSQLLAQLDPSPTMCKVLPFPQYPSPLDVSSPPPTATYWSFPLRREKMKTRLMAIINATPDSFSDGLEHNTVPSALAYARHAVLRAGAAIVDVGGCSTRPGAEEVNAEEEVARVLPIVRALREDRGVGREVVVSVDTFREEVARAAILGAGANCINDVCGFTGPASFPVRKEGWERLGGMRALARETGVPVVLMHSRGPAGENKSYDAYPGGVIEGVARELGEKVRRVVEGAGGVRRWCVMVDPGIGFSKSVRDNLRLLGRMGEVRAYLGLLEGYPMVLGPSRKSFLGAVLKSGEGGRDTAPKERVYATAAAVAHVVMQGAEVVRVHDVLEMADVVRVTEMIQSEGEE